MSDYLILAFCVSIPMFFGVLYYFQNRRQLPIELNDAYIQVLTSGACIEKNGIHIYKTKRGGFVTLSFDKDGNWIQSQEEEFDNVDDAINHFIRCSRVCRK